MQNALPAAGEKDTHTQADKVGQLAERLGNQAINEKVAGSIPSREK